MVSYNNITIAGWHLLFSILVNLIAAFQFLKYGLRITNKMSEYNQVARDCIKMNKKEEDEENTIHRDRDEDDGDENLRSYNQNIALKRLHSINYHYQILQRKQRRKVN